MKFYRDTWVEINLDAIEENIKNIKELYVNNRKLFAVVKADAYGHGAVRIAHTALQSGADYLAVATLDEALELRNHDIVAPILVFGNVRVEYLEIASKRNLWLSLHSLKWLKNAVKDYTGPPVVLHLKLETGMNRLGIHQLSDLKEIMSLLKDHKHFKLEGIFSHLASADEEDETYYQKQKQEFLSYLKQIESKDMLIHLANSAGIVKSDDGTNACRLGLLMYGLIPSKEMGLNYQPRQAISLYSKLIQVKKVKKGSKISYNCTYESSEDEYIGTIPIGYADGYDRRLPNGQVYIEGEYHPVVGRICMDLIMVRLNREYDEGTVVELIGPHITVDEMAKKLGTINYQVVCMLSDRLPRVYKKNDRIIDIVNRRNTIKEKELLD